MQVTVTIDDDVLEVAREQAERKGITLGGAISELARRGIWSTTTVRPDGMPVFRVPADAAPITSDDVRKALSDWP